MKLIVCVSDDFGISFNQRRQSKDRMVCEDIVTSAGDSCVRAHTYSARLFADYPQVVISDDYLQEADADDFCFYEKGLPEADSVDTLILYHWNRSYPSDLHLADILDISSFMLTDSREFSGSSHDCITREVYVRG